jgi:2,4-dienoyl-CoA reductase-like NADH-dependent reductase (Old Yellow Enzyme family)
MLRLSGHRDDSSPEANNVTNHHLFSPLILRGVRLRNRIMMSPMCMYSAGEDGLATDWHSAHYAARANGGAGLIVTEATAVEPRGRISRADLGLWEDGQIAPLAKIVRLCQEQGAAIGVQLAHAGRKAWSPQRGVGPEIPVAPSSIPQADDWATPYALTAGEVDEIVDAFGAAARRAHAAGLDAIEIHAAHGYLLHEFLSPISNRRSDHYGGSLENRARFLLRVVDAVRSVWPAKKPLMVRISATDWVDGGLTVDDQVQVARWLKGHDVDVVDCSSGGITPQGPPHTGPGYQVPFAEKIRGEASIATAAVGLIVAPEQADEIVRQGRADIVALGRELLRHPHWPLDAARALGQEIDWPRQYERAKLV